MLHKPENASCIGNIRRSFHERRMPKRYRGATSWRTNYHRGHQQFGNANAFPRDGNGRDHGTTCAAPATSTHRLSSSP
jgi:hypothetical protein